MHTPDGFMTSTKPYLVRAIYEWILDNRMTPHVLVDARYPGTQVPAEFVENGQIILNIAPSAVHGLVVGNDWVHFSARFGGVSRNIEFPCEAVLGIFSRENHQGMIFPPAEPDSAEAEGAPPVQREPQRENPPKGDGGGSGKGKKRPGGPKLTVVK
jgi:stringent starvation protein B